MSWCMGLANRVARKFQDGASLGAELLLTPGAVIAMVFGLWRLGEDLGWATKFVISQGLFSHWMVWIVLSAGLKTAATFPQRTRN